MKEKTEKAFVKKKLLSALLLGINSGLRNVAEISDDFIMNYYTVGIIALLLHKQPIDRYEFCDKDVTVIYENGTVIKANTKDQTYIVIYNNKKIAENWTTVAPSPKGDGKYYAYSLEETNVSLPYQCSKVTVLTFDGEAECFDVFDGILRLKEKTVYRIDKMIIKFD